MLSATVLTIPCPAMRARTMTAVCAFREMEFLLTIQKGNVSGNYDQIATVDSQDPPGGYLRYDDRRDADDRLDHV